MTIFKRLLLVSFITKSILILGQGNELPKIANDTLFTSSGFKITEGLKLKIGIGTTPDGDFKFIRRNNNSMFAYSSSTGYQSLANSANAFPRNQSGRFFEVKRIEKRGNKKHGYLYYAIIGNAIVRYEIDIENAISSGEIVVPDEFKPKPKNQIIELKQQLSIPDEILKLKKLLDEGILTKDEFEIQKKKLLEK